MRVLAWLVSREVRRLRRERRDFLRRAVRWKARALAAERQLREVDGQ